MAEIAVSGAITVLTTVLPFLDKICSVGDSRNIEVVRKWLNTMIAYLKDTEGREDTAGLKDRVQRVKNLANKTQDVIEEFMYEVPEHFHHHWITKILHEVAHSVMDVPSLRKLSSRMAEIKKEVDDITHSDPIRICPSPVALSSTTAGKVSETYNSFSRNDRRVLVGIQRRVDALLDRVFRGDQPRDLKDIVISVIGDPGSGKSTVIHEVFEMIKNNYECHAWVPVPPCQDLLKKLDPGSAKDLLKKLFQELDELPFNPGRNEEKSLQFHLQQKRYILVFDGIWSEGQWHCIKKLLPCNIKQGSKIIISTRNRKLASICTSSHDNIYDLNLNPLTSEEALELFCKVCQGDKLPDHLVHWGEEIVKRCEKSPHAIVAVGDFLSYKPLNETEFKNVLDSLEFEPGHHVSLTCYRIFWQSYRYLLPNLRSCFLYFYNFPEDHSVTCGRLIRLWIGCGFIEKRERTTLERVAYEYLDELVQMSMVCVTSRDSDGRIRSCRVSNLARGFILSESEKKFINVLGSPSASLEGEQPRCLSLHNCFPSTLQRTGLSYVRTFSMFGVDNFSESMADELFKNFKLMTCLDLEEAALQHFPEEVVNLTLLRYLSLRRTKIYSVPKSIKKLQNLMVLDLRDNPITKLHKKTLELPKLLYFFVGYPNDDVGAQVYPGIKFSTSLQKLALITANYKEISIVKELGNFIALRKLGITKLKEIEGKDLCASIEKMKHLYSLSVSSASKEVYLDLKDMKKSPHLLQKLSLGGRLKEIPAWVGELNNLYKIELKWSKLQNSPLEALHALRSLKELHLYAAYTGEILVFNAQSFLELRILEIEKCDQLNEVVILEQALPKLQKLIIRSCQSLATVCMTKKMVSQLEEVHVPEDRIRIIEE